MFVSRHVSNAVIMNIVLKTQDLAYSMSHKLYIAFSNWERKMGRSSR